MRETDEQGALAMTVAWLVMALDPSEREYRGNDGYKDDVSKLYRFDSNVQNSKQVVAGDIVVQRSRTNVIGVARVGRIESAAGTKDLYRCPNCKRAGFKTRTKRVPQHRCTACHAEFDTPLKTKESVTNYLAHLEDFVPTPDAVTIDELRRACPRYTDQLSIQRIDLSKVAAKLSKQSNSAATLLEFPQVVDKVVVEGGFDPASIVKAREVVLRAIAARQGAPEFRRSLIRNYGSRCVVTGCDVEAALEAAHIVPYQGKDTDVEENGLLLRADIHTLFDRMLLSVNPDTLTLVLHSSLRSSQYAELHGRKLSVPPGAIKPSPKALQHHFVACDLDEK